MYKIYYCGDLLYFLYQDVDVATATKGIAGGYWHGFNKRQDVVCLPRDVAVPQHCAGKHSFRLAV